MLKEKSVIPVMEPDTVKVNTASTTRARRHQVEDTFLCRKREGRGGDHHRRRPWPVPRIHERLRVQKTSQLTSILSQRNDYRARALTERLSSP